jgi:hypothetical protein
MPSQQALSQIQPLERRIALVMAIKSRLQRG